MIATLPAETLQIRELVAAGRTFLKSELVELTLFKSETGEDKTPYPCGKACKHKTCAVLKGIRSQWSTRNIGTIQEALQRHFEERRDVEVFLGLRPLKNLLIIDVDSPAALDWLIEETGLDLREHFVQITPKGWHIYITCKDKTRYRLPANAGDIRKSIDLRYEYSGTYQFIVAPNSYRGPGYEYKAFNPDIKWGDFREDDSILDLLTAPTELPEPIQIETGRLSGPEAVQRAIERARQIADDRGLTPQAMSTMGSGATRQLCSFWNICRAKGLTPIEAVHLAYDYEPVLAYHVWSNLQEGRQHQALRSAEAAYRTANLVRTQTPFRSFTAEATLERAVSTWSDVNRRVVLLRWMVNLCNKVQRPIIDVGVAEAGYVLDVSKMQGGRILKELVARDFLRMVTDYTPPQYRDGERIKGRTRSYSIVGMTST